MKRHQIKRETDLQIISGWIGDNTRILDVGCGRGILLEHLQRNKSAQVLGVDSSLGKIQSCIRRGVPAYHGDAARLLDEFAPSSFDWVILSRTVQELEAPGELIQRALTVGRNVAVGFVNYGYWLNRLSVLRTGSRPTNEVFPLSWEQNGPYNPVTIAGFTEFTQRNEIAVRKTVFLRGDWRRPVRRFPNLLAGYALFHLSSTV
jgi:methionine biosynthesis protein MetW